MSASNDTYKTKPKYSEVHPSQDNIVHHKCHMDWRGNEIVPPPQEARESPLEPWHSPYKIRKVQESKIENRQPGRGSVVMRQSEVIILA